MLTVDTHHPEGYMCNLCQDEEYYSYASSIRCASTQVNDFINWIGEQSWSENTTIVVVGDHVSMNATFWDDLPKDYLRTIYNCIINPIADTNKVTTKNRSFYAMDILPTTLGSLGVMIEGDRLGLGTNLFSERATIAEEIGSSVFEAEVAKYSNYFFNTFIMN